MTDRRGFLTGTMTLIAAPSIVRADSLMKIKPLALDVVVLPDFQIKTRYGVWAALDLYRMFPEQWDQIRLVIHRFDITNGQLINTVPATLHDQQIARGRINVVKRMTWENRA
jgi:hypothetical protein